MFSVRSILVITLAAVLAACGQPPAQSPAPRAVIAQIVGAKPVDNANVYSGEVRARYENDLAFRVGGKVVARYVDVGAQV
ncbi:MAG: efflux RND transporter periplasmic adaptor subunit, partial [Burkholderiales bacterium]